MFKLVLSTSIWLTILFNIAVADTISPTHTFNSHRSHTVNAVAFSPDGQTIVMAADNEGLILWNVNTKQEIRTFSDREDVTSVAFSPKTGKMIVSGNSDEKIILWDVNTGNDIRKFRGHTDNVLSVAFSPDEQFILSGSKDGTMKLWDVNHSKSIRNFESHNNWVSSVAFSPNGKMAVSGGYDNTLKLWDLNSGVLIHTFTGHKDAVTSVAFSPDGSMIVSGSAYSTLKLWSTQNFNEIHTFRGHNDEVNSVAFSPDGKTVLSGSDDGTLRLWDIAAKKLLHIFMRHNHWIWAVAFSPDGRYAASGSRDTTAKLWEIPKIPEADISLNMIASANSIQINTEFNYSLTITNNGPEPASNVKVENTLPAGVSFLNASGSGWTCNESNSKVICQQNNLTVGTNSIITINVKAPNDTGNITNSAIVSTSTSDSNFNNNQKSATTTITLPICQYTVSETELVVEAEQQTYNLKVNVSPNRCSGDRWTIENSLNWIDVFPRSGQGNQTVTINIDSHESPKLRQGTFTIAGQTVTINQTGISCTYSINPTEFSHESKADNGSINVSAPSECSWTATSKPDWLKITFQNDNTLNYGVEENQNPNSRNSTITITGQDGTIQETVDIYQEGLACNYRITPSSSTVYSPNVKSDKFNITVLDNCQWEVYSDSIWIRLNPTNGQGNRTVTYIMTENTTPQQRHATLTMFDSLGKVIDEIDITQLPRAIAL